MEKKALEMAVNTACPDGSRKYKINLMSDNGSQPTSIAFMNEYSTLGIKEAFTAYDNPKDNADTERVIHSLKEECIWLNEWETFKEVITGTRKGVKDYNMDHIHSALDYLSPDKFEKKLEKENTIKNAA